VTTLARIPLRSRTDIESALESHVGACERDLRERPQRPLYGAGVRYDRRDADERWQLPRETAARGRGDCEDLASWRAAELRLAGERGARVVVRRTGPTVLHAVVRRASGKIEDPSLRLGMARPVGRIGDSMATGKITWKMKRTADGEWQGEATVPLPSAAASVSASARGRTRGDAASRTLKALQDVTRSPLVSSLLPPGAGPALQAALSVSRSVARLFKKKKKRTSASPSTAVSGYQDIAGRAAIERAMQRRGASPELCQLAGACWG